MARNKLYFNTLAAALLYKWELTGQISDGKYENSRPYDHWKWICDTKVIVDPNGLNYAERFLQKKYTLQEWSGYMKDGRNDWAWRCANYVRFGACFESTQENYDLITANVSSCTVECLKEKYDSYEACKAHINSLADWAKSENFFEIFTEEVYNKYYSQEVSIKEFNKYHTLMKKTVNRDKWDAEKDEELAKEKAAKKEAEKEAKKAAKKAETEKKKEEFMKQLAAQRTEVTSATTEDDLIAPQNKVSALELKLEAIKFIKEKYGIDVKELNVKL